MKKSTAPKPAQANQSNGTLKGPKTRHTDSSKNPSGLLGKGESNAKLGKGGKAVC